MSLTPKQEKFAQCIADGMSQADAYRESFKVRPTTKPESIYVEASKLMANPNVSQRVDDLKSMLTQKALWTREESVETLADIARGNDEFAKTADRVNAVKALNAMHGWDKINIEHSGNMGITITAEDYKAAEASIMSALEGDDA